MTQTLAEKVAAKTMPVIEVFGPVIQGEGLLAGVPTHFVRLGGCDYRCSWCDSMYAVEPELVRKHAEKLTYVELHQRILDLRPGPQWITLSGGNPVLHPLGPLVRLLHAQSFKVCVETQGSRWRDWLDEVDLLTVSPKPPSSDMATKAREQETLHFMAKAAAAGMAERGCVKVVVFDEADLEWAAHVFKLFHKWPAYLSVGTDPIRQWGKDWEKHVSDRQVRDNVGDRYAWLCEAIAGRPEFAHVRVFPQLHVIAFGHARGV